MMAVPIIAVAAVDQSWAIGYENRLLYRLSADLRRFKTITMGGVLVMGYRTFASLPGLLPGREHVVVSRHAKIPGATVCASPDDALTAAQALAQARGTGVFVIGGAMVYAALLPYCDQVYLTKFEIRAPRADAYFPPLDALPGWRLAERSTHMEQNGIRYRFCRYENGGLSRE